MAPREGNGREFLLPEGDRGERVRSVLARWMGAGEEADESMPSPNTTRWWECGCHKALGSAWKERIKPMGSCTDPPRESKLDRSSTVGLGIP